jgi:hypothetical protein
MIRPYRIEKEAHLSALHRLAVAAVLAVPMAFQSFQALATPIAPETFTAAATQIDAAKLSALALAVEADPRGVANRLQGDVGGRGALQRYAAAMLQQGQAQRLGRQWAVLVADKAVLAAPETKDGSVWFPRAKDAGFFTGGIAAALSRHSGAVSAFARGAGLPEPAKVQSIPEWLSQPAALLPRPARSAFDRAQRAGAV